MIGIAVVGFGYWGPNLVRNFSLASDAAVVAVCDQRADRLAMVNKLYPAVATYTDVDAMLADPNVDAVAIATPLAVAIVQITFGTPSRTDSAFDYAAPPGTAPPTTTPLVLRV